MAPVTTSSNQQMDILGKKLKILERLIVASRAIADSLDPYEATQVRVESVVCRWVWVDELGDPSTKPAPPILT